MTVNTDSCAICCDFMSVENKGVPVIGTEHPDPHWFHADCISKWFNVQQRAGRLPSCPICKRDVTHINAQLIPHVPADPERPRFHPIVYAALNRDDHLIRRFLEREDIEDISEDEIMLVLSLASPDIREALIQSGRVSDRNRGLEVMADASRGIYEDLGFLLNSGQISSRHRGEAVVYAARNGDERSLSLLLDHGPISALHRTVAVCLALRAGHYNSALMLCRRGGLVNSAVVIGIVAVAAFSAIQYRS